MNSPCPSHELVLETEKPYSYTFCDYCDLEITGPYYRCSGLDLHKSCLQPSNQIQHPFHPQHPLFLNNSKTKVSCNACGKDHKSATYNCSLCSFCLHFICTKLTPVIKTSQEEEKGGGGGGKVLLPDHPHPFFLCSKDDEFSDYYYCDYCMEPLRDLIYVCLECKLSLHKTCAQLPGKIHHLLHPPHPLSLMTFISSLKCSFCGLSCYGYCYRCEECKYYLDASCSCLMPIRDNTRRHEGGTLILLHADLLHDMCKLCEACGQFIQDANDPIFFCSKCEIFLHTSCAELPGEIKTPVDPLHPLKLEGECITGPISKASKLKNCTMCNGYCRDFVYRCSDCEIILDLKCALSLQPTTLVSINHHHPLVLFSSKQSHEPISCSKCEKRYSFPFFRCFSCKLDLHAHCLPKLPTTIKSPYHRHSLTLTYSSVKDWPDESDYADFYCDNCEEKRNLHEPTYFCEQCHFVAHLGCVLTQVMHLLEEEWSAASKLGNLKYETYADLYEGLLMDIDHKLAPFPDIEEHLEKLMEQVRAGRKQLEEARVQKDPLTMSRLRRSYNSLMVEQKIELVYLRDELSELRRPRKDWMYLGKSLSIKTCML